MTRAECETRIAEHMEAIIQIAKEYNPHTKYLSAAYCADKTHESYYLHNEYFSHDSPDEKLPIDFTITKKRRWGNLKVEFDVVTATFCVLVDGEVEFEHLAQDEVSKVVRDMMP